MRYVKTFEDYKHNSKFSRDSDPIIYYTPSLNDSSDELSKDLHSVVYDGVESYGPMTDRNIEMIDAIATHLEDMLTKKGYITKNVLKAKESGIL